MSKIAERRIVASFSDPKLDGDVFDVVANFPANLGDADAIAVLAWSAARNEEIAFDEFMNRVHAAAADIFIASPQTEAKPTGGRPAKDWDAEYGKSALLLELSSIIRQVASPGMTRAAARRAALVDARAEARLGKRSLDTIEEDAEKLKQALR